MQACITTAQLIASVDLHRHFFLPMSYADLHNNYINKYANLTTQLYLKNKT